MLQDGVYATRKPNESEKLPHYQGDDELQFALEYFLHSQLGL
jgi:hypothetical protein